MDNLDAGNGGEGEVEMIPWRYVPYRVRWELIKRLNPNLLGNDWRMLAGKLGYTLGEIHVSV